MSRRRSGYIQLDVSEVIEQIDDDVLLDELHARKLTPAAPGDEPSIEIIREGYEAMLRGRIAEAKSIFDRLLFPKWKSPAKCREAYETLPRLLVQGDR